MIKALQVLSEGKHYGKLFFVGEKGGTIVTGKQIGRAHV